jgi:uncharacterized protein (DUF2336 family)
MTAATSLIPGLDAMVRDGDPERLAEVARRIVALFLKDAGQLSSKHVDFFDSLLVDLVPHADLKERAELAERLSLLGNAPRALVGQMARDNELLVAGPLLRRSSVIDEMALLEIARAMGQGHLLAMSERPSLSIDLTDIIIGRGDRDVVRRAAGNSGARFSERGYFELVRRAGSDGVLTLAVGQRADLSDAHLKLLLAGSLDVVRRRLLDVVGPERQAAIKQAIGELTDTPEHVASHRDFVPAQRAIIALHQAGHLNEAALIDFAKAFAYEESVVALAVFSGVAIGTLDRLLASDRHDPVLIIGKFIGLEWATVRALILLRLGPHRVPAAADIENARLNFARLMPSTAERVVNFWKSRRAG